MLTMSMGTSRIMTFDSAPYGKLPPGWTATCTHPGAPAKWEIVKDPTAPSQPYVLAQVSRAGPGDRAPIAILNGAQIRDGEVSVKFKPVAGKENQAAGVVWRYRDPNNYYVARANALDNNVAIFRVQNGKRVPVAVRGRPSDTLGVKRNVNSNAWSILKVTFKGSNFAVYYDHRRILQAQDNSFGGAGSVGLWTKADSVAYFDNFRFVKKN